MALLFRPWAKLKEEECRSINCNTADKPNRERLDCVECYHVYLNKALGRVSEPGYK